MVLFLSAAQMAEVVAELEPRYGAGAAVVVAYRVGWPDQQIFRCALAEAPARMESAAISRTALVFIGPMLDDSPGPASRLYDKSFSHLFRKGVHAPRPEGPDGP